MIMKVLGAHRSTQQHAKEFVHEFEFGMLATFPFAVIIAFKSNSKWKESDRQVFTRWGSWFDIPVSAFLSLSAFRDRVTEYKAGYVLSEDAGTPAAVYFNRYFFFEDRDSHVVLIWQLLMWTALINVDIWADYSPSTSMGQSGPGWSLHSFCSCCCSFCPACYCSLLSGTFSTKNTGLENLTLPRCVVVFSTSPVCANRDQNHQQWHVCVCNVSNPYSSITLLLFQWR